MHISYIPMLNKFSILLCLVGLCITFVLYQEQRQLVGTGGGAGVSILTRLPKLVLNSYVWQGCIPRYPKHEIRFRADRHCSQLARGGIRVGVLPFYDSGFLDDLWRCTHELTPSRFRSRGRRDNCSRLRCMGSPSYTRRERSRGRYDPGPPRGSERYPDCRLYGIKKVAYYVSWYVLLVPINDPR